MPQSLRLGLTTANGLSELSNIGSQYIFVSIGNKGVTEQDGEDLTRGLAKVAGYYRRK